jgi:S1-C subfamily serine protease
MSSEESMSLVALSTELADAVANAEASLLGLPTRHGTGTLLAVTESLAVTTSRAARRNREHVLLPDGSPAPVRLVGVARGLDLAVYEVRAELTPITWSDDLRTGQLVIPVAYGPRATLGMLSRVGSAWRTQAGNAVDRWIEVDGSLPSGFGGGPLLAPDGTALGLNVRRLARDGTTLPGSTVHRALEALRSRGTTEPAFLGIGGATATLTPAQAEAAEQKEALLVVAVTEDTPAAGVLTVGDIVLRVAGQPVRGVASLRSVLVDLTPDQVVTLDVLSALQVEERTVTLSGRPGRLC